MAAQQHESYADFQLYRMRKAFGLRQVPGCHKKQRLNRNGEDRKENALERRNARWRCRLNSLDAGELDVGQSRRPIAIRAEQSKAISMPLTMRTEGDFGGVVVRGQVS